MTSSKEVSQDHWVSTAYQSAASFVPKLTKNVFEYLDPKPDELILDLGCGDGVLTIEIARSAKTVVGLDSSKNLIESAKELAIREKINNISFAVEDCAKFGSDQTTEFLPQNHWDKVFSNAAYHWILRESETRYSAWERVYKTLKPGGLFVFECGGHGNVAEIVVAIKSALIAIEGWDIQKARDSIPWYFPNEEWTTEQLGKIGFIVEKIESEYRSTKLNPNNDQGEGGIEGWLKVFGASILHKIENKDQVIQYACQLLENVITKDDQERSLWVGYVRLRVVAKKPYQHQ